MPLDESPFLNVPGGSRGGSQRGLAAKNEVVKVNPFSFLEPNLRDSFSDSISQQQRQRSISPTVPFSSTKDAVTNRLETAKTTLNTNQQTFKTTNR